MKFISIGSDPEFLVLDPKGKPYPATLFASGTKDNPSPIPSLGEGFFEQRDNLAFEGNIPPAYNKEDFILSMKALRQYFANKVGKFGYSLSPNGVEIFAKRYLRTKEGMEFGCSEIVNSWHNTDELTWVNTPVLDLIPSRVAGFHIHIGYKTVTSRFLNVFSKNQMDLLIGRLFDMFITYQAHLINYEKERAYSYGEYGVIRPKVYGVECRSLSAFFTQEQYLSWVWDQVFTIERFINEASNKDLKWLISKAFIIEPNIPHFKSVAQFLLEKVDSNVVSRYPELVTILNKEEINGHTDNVYKRAISS